ncbi:hypothetical protein D5039_08785 [Verminephrobacter aporrectodeae subsp. tuberculatae]|uniref:Uncharacterized protein n=1 Tax=Verminephrobacter aporrectodeae subsp. tuberculatae TaxID=1110392 RepID=A0ABT3KSK8_9BURK|nr:hypothetical protein [Verminephrobacter aporrectodeae subsp. tuberculatae]MCW5321250.1 hypothetical protein [Verminephrobacter aporrectodeae subsp. tuberculatae]
MVKAALLSGPLRHAANPLPDIGGGGGGGGGGYSRHHGGLPAPLSIKPGPSSAFLRGCACSPRKGLRCLFLRPLKRGAPTHGGLPAPLSVKSGPSSAFLRGCARSLRTRLRCLFLRPLNLGAPAHGGPPQHQSPRSSAHHRRMSAGIRTRTPSTTKAP